MAFEDMIDKIDVPMALMYGKEDPWVVPLWGHRIKRQRPETLYYEISPSGHSPHHETPNTVNALLAGWLEHAGSGAPAPLSGEGEVLEMEVRGRVRWTGEGAGLRTCVLTMDAGRHWTKFSRSAPRPALTPPHDRWSRLLAASCTCVARGRPEKREQEKAELKSINYLDRGTYAARANTKPYARQ